MKSAAGMYSTERAKRPIEPVDRQQVGRQFDPLPVIGDNLVQAITLAGLHVWRPWRSTLDGKWPVYAKLGGLASRRYPNLRVRSVADIARFEARWRNRSQSPS